MWQDVLDEDNDKKKGLDDGGKAHQNVPLEYKQLIAIPAGKPKGSLDDFLKVDPDKVRRLSLSELELEKAVITHGKEIVRYLQEPTSQRNCVHLALLNWIICFVFQGIGQAVKIMDCIKRISWTMKVLREEHPDKFFIILFISV